MKKTILIVAMFMLLAGCSGSDKNEPLPKLDLASGDYECVSLVTNKGKITLGLDWKHAPKSVTNFLNYTRNSFYNGTIFHRVIDGFMVQGGGYDDAYVKKETNIPVTNEADNGLLNSRGTIAAARTSDPHSATAQFFINTVDNRSLNFRNKTKRGWGYAVFGQVVSGMDVVDKIARVSTGAGGPFNKDVPSETIIIQKVNITACSEVRQ